jgi:hypothetical protein
MGGELTGRHLGVTRQNSLRSQFAARRGRDRGESFNTVKPTHGAAVFPLTPQLGCIPGIAGDAGGLDCRAVEFLEHWRLPERPLEPTCGRRRIFQVRDHPGAGHPRKLAPDTIEPAFAPPRTIPRELNHGVKLALEFTRRPEYPEVKVTAANAVVRDMNRHQTLAIA